ncbi:thioredoxin-1 [Drosophila madeirensis]|uniref:Thioredoxin n=1 Tax=Drosophila madeirensis TaxID=30013 RepID=A0AAU9FWK1_DROMD
MTCIRSVNDFQKKMDAAENKLVVLDFYATWCKPCRDISKTVKSLAEKYSAEAVVLKINVDRYEDLVEQYKVTCMPTFVFLRGKKRLARIAGVDQNKLMKTMAKLIKPQRERAGLTANF